MWGAIIIAWLTVSPFACIIVGKFIAAGNPADDSAHSFTDTHEINSITPGVLPGPTAAAAKRPFLRSCVNGVPGLGLTVPRHTAPKVRNAAPINQGRN